uniref:Riboflavin synthase n=1 Tax=Ammonifex degensii TaxID=42838 RepID=A0A7C1FDS9_9THEO
MFTGIVEELGQLKSITRQGVSARLVVGAERIMENLRVGDSVAVNGVCLTVTDLKDKAFSADVMAETLSNTNLGELNVGARVNLERALQLGDRLGGHLVTGHIDGVGRILRKEKREIAWVFSIAAPETVARYLVRKGSVAVDGISLTVVEAWEDGFTVSVIPHTASVTTLGFKGPGDTVNLEADLIGKYVEKFLGALRLKGISKDFLAEHNFI